jgi:hypothetical protein
MNTGSVKPRVQPMTSDTNSGTYYTIRLREKLDDGWGEWFETMTMTTDDEGTLLAGLVADQAALHGIIARVQRLGLQLVAINQQERSENS